MYADYNNDHEISTHTPARGVTDATNEMIILQKISTHTPARGVTKTGEMTLRTPTDFYSHAREGRDVYAVLL